MILKNTKYQSCTNIHIRCTELFLLCYLDCYKYQKCQEHPGQLKIEKRLSDIFPIYTSLGEPVSIKVLV